MPAGISLDKVSTYGNGEIGDVYSMGAYVRRTYINTRYINYYGIIIFRFVSFSSSTLF